jgi:hypothetical protein
LAGVHLKTFSFSATLGLEVNISKKDSMAAELNGDMPQAEDAPPEKPETTTTVDDAKTEQAVDDIVHHESDEIIAVEDAKQSATPARAWYKKLFAKKKLWIPLVIVLLVAVIGSVPYSRYKLLGLFWKQTYNVSVIDSQTKLPVSDAQVSLDGHQQLTTNQGQASLKVAVGTKSLGVSKKYYAELNDKVLVGLHAKGRFIVSLRATGRQVPIKVVNLINGLPLANAEVTAAGTSAKTDKAGQVTIVLPANKTSVSATVSGSGYNNATAPITVSANILPANTFKLTPSGTIYFLSNASGTIDVVSTNLDGTNPQTVIAGTGHEDPNNTSLLASRDWHFLALQAKRDTDQNSNSLYLIDTSTNKLTTMDVGNATFTPIGWSGHYFLYDVSRNDIPFDQNDHEALKSYNADTGQLTTLDQTTSTQTNGTNVIYNGFSNQQVVGSQLVYTVQWYADYPANSSDLSGQTDSLRGIQPNGQGKKDYQTFDASQVSNIQTMLYKPDVLDIGVYGLNAAGLYYQFQNNAVAAVSNIDFSQSYPTYLLSPSGNQTFWSEPRDGKNTLFVGDASGDNGTQIATLSDYVAYGWYGDSYVIVEKGGNELYIMPASGGTALKISDYFQASQNLAGYDGGYGGL